MTRYSHLDPQRERGSSALFWGIVVFALLAAVLLIGMLASEQIKSQVEESIDKKIENITPPKIVTKYDSATQAKVDSIEANRLRSHQHIDNFYGGELQDVLDSLYNDQR